MSNTAATRTKVDRRVLRTRRAIMEAFDKLLTQIDADKITVSAIAREADIDRKTFYLHYGSVAELADYKAKTYVERVIETLTCKAEGKTTAECVHIALEEVNRIITDEIELFEHIASTLSTDQILSRLTRTAHESEAAEASDLPKLDESMHLCLQFYTAGALSLYSSWLLSGHKTPIEAISQTIESAMVSNVFPDLARA